MSIDRFMAIVYPIECISYRTSKNMLHAIYIKWILILLIASPTISVHGLIDSPLGPDQFNCRFLTDHYNPLHFQITFFITSYLFPLILIFCLYLSLLNKLWFGNKPVGHRESSKMLESKKKVTWLVAGIVVVFALCWCPIQVMLILMRLRSHKITATYVAVQVFAHTLGYTNSCINPIVYAFASETFHQSFKRSWLGRIYNFCCGRGSLNASGTTRTNSIGGVSQQTNQNNNHSHHHHERDFEKSRHSTHGPPGTNVQLTTTTTTTTSNENNNNNRKQSLNYIFSPNNNNNNNGNGPIEAAANKNGSLGNDNTMSTTTLLITSHNTRTIASDNIRPNNKPLPALEPRDRIVVTSGAHHPWKQPQSQAQHQHHHQMASLQQSIRLSNLTSNTNNNNDDGGGHETTITNGPHVPSPSPPPSSNNNNKKSKPITTGALIPRHPTASGSYAPTTIMTQQTPPPQTPTTRAPTPPSLSSSSSSPHQAPTSTNMPPKQQLVARMVQSSNQVAHECEPAPCEQP